MRGAPRTLQSNPPGAPPPPPPPPPPPTGPETHARRASHHTNGSRRSGSGTCADKHESQHSCTQSRAQARASRKRARHSHTPQHAKGRRMHPQYHKHAQTKTTPHTQERNPAPPLPALAHVNWTKHLWVALLLQDTRAKQRAHPSHARPLTHACALRRVPAARAVPPPPPHPGPTPA